MLTQFLASFECTGTRTSQFNSSDFKGIHESVVPVVKMIGGMAFDNGLYRVHVGEEIDQYNSKLFEVFPEYKNQVCVFGYDWLGRQFAVEIKQEQSTQQVLLFEPGAGEVMVIPASIEEFHNRALVNHTNEALAKQFFDDWQAVNSAAICHDQCVGYKIPLFLGGKDDIENLELVDLMFYLDLCGQLRNQI